MTLLILSLGLLSFTMADPPAKASDAEKPAGPASITEKTKGFRKLDGFFPLYWDDRAGKLYLEVNRLDSEFLYQVALASGLGSNVVGLDRGQLADGKVVTFRRIGPKVLLIERNLKYRANSDNPAERKAVEESFASSVQGGFKVEAEEKDRVLIDVSDFFLRDAHGVAERLRSAKQGTYRLDVARSAIDPARTKGFPRNTEIEAILTFATDGEPGKLVAQTAASGEAATVRLRHSLIALPPLDGRFRPRSPDPRVGVFSIDFYDFATPFTEPVERQWITRFRLIKKDPDATVSDPEEPIVFHVDRGAPEPIRQALVEGASWWKAAFEAAGFSNAFRVEVLPADADPMDLRYNMIHWIHRSTRGWSFGNTVVDPRTGEILKGRVLLDSLRGRQDALIGTGLLAGGAGRDGCAAGAIQGPEYLADPGTAALAELVLARIRQLSAHEVGHSLGLAHNFAGSVRGRSSVMDYPAPLVKIADGKLDLSDAYAKGIGAYDRFAITYAYASFPPGKDETKELRAIVRRGLADGLLFLADADSRPPGAAHPLANLWDNGDNPVASLRHEMEVRRIGLDGFGLDRIAEGSPLSDLEAKLLPLYLHHRYQLVAAVKSVGGANYSYAVKEGTKASPEPVVAPVPADTQREALVAVLATMRPDVLRLPDRILALIPPRAFDRPSGTAELFEKTTGPLFDPVAAATIAADIAVSGLLQPERAARLNEFHGRDRKFPDFAEVVSRLVKETWQSPDGSRARAIARAEQTLVVQRLIDLGENDAARPDVRAVASDALSRLADPSFPWPGVTGSDPHQVAIRQEIERFLRRPAGTNRRTPTVNPPPGDPIGGASR
ncbi:MAG: zinc-dependent metalloprotease [Isosphaeraceae bacterium]